MSSQLAWRAVCRGAGACKRGSAEFATVLAPREHQCACVKAGEEGWGVIGEECVQEEGNSA